MPADAVVVDASALAALLFGEPDGPDIARRLEGLPLVAPTLLRYEVASVCVKKAKEQPEKEADFRVALGLLEQLGIREVQVPPQGMLDAASDSGLTVYDAAYLWLARHFEAELVSLDRQLIAAAGRR